MSAYENPDIVEIMRDLLEPMIGRIEELEKANKELAGNLDAMRVTIKAVVNANGKAKAMPRLSRTGVVGNAVES